MSYADIDRKGITAAILEYHKQGRINWHRDGDAFVTEFGERGDRHRLVLLQSGPAHNSNVELRMLGNELRQISMSGPEITELFEKMKVDVRHRETAPYFAALERGLGSRGQPAAKPDPPLAVGLPPHVLTNSTLR